MFFIGWHAVFTTTTLTSEQHRLLGSEPAVAIVRTADTPVQGDPQAAEAGGLERPAVALLALDLHAGGFGGASMGVSWAVALVELIGGVLLVVGLLTRFWALVVVVVLGGLFWVVSVGTADMFGMSPLRWLDAPLSFYALYLQVLGMVLALGLLCSGGGRLSIDHLLFGRPAANAQVSADDD
jgi:uncharacterized membrane protein YphA (DoxX/SURF4 family)